MGREVGAGRRSIGREEAHKAGSGVGPHDVPGQTLLGGVRNGHQSRIVGPGSIPGTVVPFACGTALAIGSDGRVLGYRAASGHEALACSRASFSEIERRIDSLGDVLEQSITLVVNALDIMVSTPEGSTVSALRDIQVVADKLLKLGRTLVRDEVRHEEPLNGVPHSGISGEDLRGPFGDDAAAVCVPV